MSKGPRSDKAHEAAPHHEAQHHETTHHEAGNGAAAATVAERPPETLTIAGPMPLQGASQGELVPAAEPPLGGNLPAVIEPLDEMAEFVADAEQSQGRGVSSDAADIIIPGLIVLQGLSPQVDPGDPSYIEGAKPGTIWLRNFSNPLLPGDEGCLFQACAFWVDWFRWLPRDRGGGRGTGFVATYQKITTVPDPRAGRAGKVALKVPTGEVAVEMPDPRDAERKKMRWEFSDGTVLVETRHHVGYAIFKNGVAVPFVINLSSTGHTVSKNWMFGMNAKYKPGGNRPLDSWWVAYKLTTGQRGNKAGKWYELRPADGTVKDLAPGLFHIAASGEVVHATGEIDPKRLTGWPAGLYLDKTGRARGEALHKAVMSGTHRFEMDVGAEQDDTPVPEQGQDQGQGHHSQQGDMYGREQGDPGYGQSGGQGGVSDPAPF